MKIGKLKFPDNTQQLTAGVYTPGQIVYAADADPFWGDVILSMDMNTLKDRRGKTITANGNAVISTAQSKFGGSSLFLDGTADWVDVGYTTEFNLKPSVGLTIEAWIYIAGNSSPDGNSLRHGTIFGITQAGSQTQMNLWVRGDATTTGTGIEVEYANNADYSSGRSQTVAISQGVWHHIALCMDQTSTRFYIDGVQYTQTAAAFDIPWSGSITLSIGRAYPDTSVWARMFNGYIDDLRITRAARYTSAFTPPTQANPTALVSSTVQPIATQGDPFWSDVVVCLDMENLWDRKTNANLALSGDNVGLTTAKKFGSKGLYVDGSADYASLAADSRMYLGKGDFTIECWVNLSDVTGTRPFMQSCPIASASNNDWWFAHTSGISFYVHGGTYALSSGAPGTMIANQWYHVAACRKDGILKLFLDGIEVASATCTTELYQSGLVVGGMTTPYWSVGSFDDIRITKFARYTANFTPPVQPNPTFAYQPVAIQNSFPRNILGSHLSTARSTDGTFAGYWGFGGNPTPSYFNASTGIATVPETGYYQITVSMELGGTTSSGRTFAVLRKNGGDFMEMVDMQNISYYSGGNQVTVYLVAGDSISVYGYTSVSIQAYLTMMLIGT